MRWRKVDDVRDFGALSVGVECTASCDYERKDGHPVCAAAIRHGNPEGKEREKWDADENPRQVEAPIHQ